jgi:hypothetical protein
MDHRHSAGRLQSGEVFLQEHFVLPVLYVQLRACPVEVYARAFVNFRKMFSREEKGRLNPCHPERLCFSSRRRDLSLRSCGAPANAAGARFGALPQDNSSVA